MVSWKPYLRPYMICSYHINDDDQIDAEESGVNGFLETISKTIYGFLETIFKTIHDLFIPYQRWWSNRRWGVGCQWFLRNHIQDHLWFLGYHSKIIHEINALRLWNHIWSWIWFLRRANPGCWNLLLFTAINVIQAVIIPQRRI